MFATHIFFIFCFLSTQFGRQGKKKRGRKGEPTHSSLCSPFVIAVNNSFRPTPPPTPAPLPLPPLDLMDQIDVLKVNQRHFFFSFFFISPSSFHSSSQMLNLFDLLSVAENISSSKRSINSKINSKIKLIDFKTMN